MKTAITPTLEDYLEAILHIVKKSKVARSMEIAEKLKVKRPTVTVALRSLAEKGLINYAPRSYVTLTVEGEKIAQNIDRKHNVLKAVFTDILGLSKKQAEESACRMEHGMTSAVHHRMTDLVKAVRSDKQLAKNLNAAVRSVRGK